MDERQLAVDLYNGLWPLMEKDARTPEEDAQLVHQAHASLYHWSQVGEQVNRARGEWMCSRVYAVVGRAEPALWHAHRCIALAEPSGDWDLAIAYEALARAAVVAGDPEAARAAIARAREVEIAEDDDREVVEKDLADVDARLTGST
jgi:hypothetical protein